MVRKGSKPLVLPNWKAGAQQKYTFANILANFLTLNRLWLSRIMIYKSKVGIESRLLAIDCNLELLSFDFSVLISDLLYWN